MQILASRSEEFGLHEGLGIIPGTVTAIPERATDGEKLKRPHVGWSGLVPAGAGWGGSPLAAVQEGAGVYFVHSFEFRADRPENVLATALYGGHHLTAAVRGGRVFGSQFHPEKSGPSGLAILGEFVRMAGAA
jgi:glutamine amidotransferase